MTHNRLVSIAGIVLIMIGVACTGAALVRNALAEDGKPVGRNKAIFKFGCRYSHSLNDDPIVYPDQPGKAHRHDFYGNPTTNAASNTGSLLTTGSTCDEPLDHAAYWQPSIGVPAAGGQVTWIQPSQILPYYEYGGTDDTPPVEQFPLGLRMIAGSASNTALLNTDFIYWQCVMGTGEDPIKTPPSGELVVCDQGFHVSALIIFPDCWDGNWLYPSNPQAYQHMVYSGGTPKGGPDCPASHPVKLPQLSMRIHWRTFQGSADAFLSSDLVTPAGAANHGRSMHADFWNAWDPGRLKILIAECLNSGQGCLPGGGGTPVPEGILPPPYPTGKEPNQPLPGDCSGSDGPGIRDDRINGLDLALVLIKDGQNYPPCDFAQGSSGGVIDDADLAVVLAEWNW